MASDVLKSANEILQNVEDDSNDALKTIDVGIRTGAVVSGTSVLTPKFASIALAGSGDVVALVASKKIRVLALYGHGTTTGTIKFQSGASTDKTGAMKVNDGTPINWGFNPLGWIETAAGEKLNAVLTTMTAFTGCLVYVEV